jgi:hypothetical protein
MPALRQINVYHSTGGDVPTIAIPIAALAALVFVGLGLASVSSIPETAERSLVGLLDYAALVLTFAGGVHWGLGLAPNAARPSIRLVAGIIPLILAWVSLAAAQFVGAPLGLVMLMIAYLATRLAEYRAGRGLFLPPRYVWLRVGLSCVALVMMAVALVLRTVGQTIVF